MDKNPKMDSLPILHTILLLVCVADDFGYICLDKGKES